MESLKEFVPGMDLVAKTFAGLEGVLAEELTLLGALDVEPIIRGVKFRGDTAILYKSNYLARTAIRVLKPIGVFEVTNDDMLYEKVRKIDWTRIFTLEQTFSVEANVFHSELDHSHFVALKTKDAIVDQFRDALGKRPWVDTDNPDIFIDVHISQDVCTISLDSSGHSLHKRGYRIAADKAPINEVLAAGMIKLSGWKGDSDFYDPMCGSGTISIEAAMVAMNIPAGYYREKFGFMSWDDFDAPLWESVKEEANAGMGEMTHRIFASDRSDKAIGFAKANLKYAGLHKDVELQQQYFDAVRPVSENGVLMMNPPYGLRLEERGELRDLYRNIGDTLKQYFTGHDAWIITPGLDTYKFIGLRPARRIELYNGPIETRLLKFEVYEGTKRYGEDNRVNKLKSRGTGEGGRFRRDRDDRPGRDGVDDRRGSSGFRPRDERNRLPGERFNEDERKRPDDSFRSEKGNRPERSFGEDRRRKPDGQYGDDRRRKPDDTRSGHKGGRSENRYGDDRRRKSDGQHGDDKPRRSDNRFGEERRNRWDEQNGDDRRSKPVERFDNDKRKKPDDRFRSEQGNRPEKSFGEDRKRRTDDRYGNRERNTGYPRPETKPQDPEALERRKQWESNREGHRNRIRSYVNKGDDTGEKPKRNRRPRLDKE